MTSAGVDGGRVLAMKDRIIVWFSCGAASAVASKETITRYGTSHEVVIVNCDTRINEHPDNYRFSADCEKWFGQPIVYIRSDDYKSVDEVFEAVAFCLSPASAL